MSVSKKPRGRPKSPAVAKQPSRPVGRPCGYDPAICQQVEELMAQGFSLGVVAGGIGVARSTLALWESNNPELSDTISRGRAKAQLYWEKQLQRVATVEGGPGTSQAVLFGLKNRSPLDWADKQQIEHTGHGLVNNPVTISILPVPAGHFFNEVGELVPDPDVIENASTIAQS